MEEQEEVVLRKLRRCRKSFYVEYLCGIVILLLFALLTIFKGSISKYLTYSIGGFLVLAVITPEIERLFSLFTITTKKVVVTHGLVKQVKENVYFQPLAFQTDLHVKQDRAGRFLNYGSIQLTGQGNDKVWIKDIDSPMKILDIIEGLVDGRRDDFHEKEKEKWIAEEKGLFAGSSKNIEGETKKE